MDEITRDAIVSIVAIIAIFGILYVYLVSRHRERMMMLEKDLPTSQFQSIAYSNLLALKYGMLLAGIGIGIFISNILTNYGIDRRISFLSMTFLFGGLGLILSYLIIKKQSK